MGGWARSVGPPHCDATSRMWLLGRRKGGNNAVELWHFCARPRAHHLSGCVHGVVDPLSGTCVCASKDGMVPTARMSCASTDAASMVHATERGTSASARRHGTAHDASSVNARMSVSLLTARAIHQPASACAVRLGLGLRARRPPARYALAAGDAIIQRAAVSARLGLRDATAHGRLQADGISRYHPPPSYPMLHLRCLCRHLHRLRRRRHRL